MHEHLNAEQLDRLRALGDVNEGITLSERERLDGIYSKAIADGNPTDTLATKAKPERLYPAETYLMLDERTERYEIDTIQIHKLHGPITDDAVRYAAEAHRKIASYSLFIDYANAQLPGSDITEETKTRAYGMLQGFQESYSIFRNMAYQHIDVDELFRRQAEKNNGILNNNPIQL